jgi:hypothetical protein
MVTAGQEAPVKAAPGRILMVISSTTHSINWRSLKMTKSRLLLAAMAAAVAGAAFTSTAPQAEAQAYFSQRAVQDRDYARMQAQTARMGKSETVKVSKKKKAKKSKSAKKSGGGDAGKSYSWQNVRGSTSPQYLPSGRGMR